MAYFKIVYKGKERPLSVRFAISAVIVNKRNCMETRWSIFSKPEMLQSFYVHFGKLSLISNNLKVWWSYHCRLRIQGRWIYREFYNPINLIKTIIRKLLWTANYQQMLSLFNKQLRSYDSLCFVTFSEQSMSYACTRFGTKKALKLIEPIFERFAVVITTTPRRNFSLVIFWKVTFVTHHISKLKHCLLLTAIKNGGISKSDTFTACLNK